MIRTRTSFVILFLFVVLVTMLTASPVAAQIDTAVIEKNRAALEKQSTDKDMKRERGTQPEDWNLTLPEGVNIAPDHFLFQWTRCYGRIFFPKGFSSCRSQMAWGCSGSWHQRSGRRHRKVCSAIF